MRTISKSGFLLIVNQTLVEKSSQIVLRAQKSKQQICGREQQPMIETIPQLSAKHEVDAGSAYRHNLTMHSSRAMTG